jgi:hypothetical protein
MTVTAYFAGLVEDGWWLDAIGGEVVGGNQPPRSENFSAVTSQTENGGRPL